jgi:hypothetical protein
MKKLIVAAVLAGSLISFEAQAQERVGSAALGALSGAIVLGPVGAVAGAFVGYTAGPEIGRSLRGGQPAPRSRVRRAARSGSKQPVAASVVPLPVARTQPPVAKAPESVASAKAAPPVAPTAATIASTKSAPPIQTFE